MVELKEIEKARTYKMGIDAKRRENRKNIEILLEKIEGYNLFKKRNKKRIVREILEVFSKNEEKEKGGSYYKAAVEVIEKAEKTYNILEQLEEELRKKEEEEAKKDREMNEINLDKNDEITLNDQMRLRRKLKNEREMIRSKIEEKKKEIEKIKYEIMVIEEKIGKKSEVDEGEEDDNENIGSSNGNTLSRKKRKKATTLGEYYEQTIKDLREKYMKRREIIRILEGGVGIENEGAGIEEEGNDLTKKIKKEVSDIFFSYYDKKQGGLGMKAARRDRNNKRKRNQEKITKEKREEFIMRRYEKKLNIDKLFRFLELIKNLDNESKERIKSNIRKNFYDNFNKAKKDIGEYILPDIQYQNSEMFKKQIERKITELKECTKKKIEEIHENKEELARIEEELDKISKKAIRLENSSYLKRRKHKKKNIRRDTLVAQSKEIRGKIGVLEKEKMELNLLTQGYELFKDEDEETIKKKILEVFSKKEEYKEFNKTPKILLEYKEKYMERIKYKEKYMENELAEIEKMDLGIDEEEKKRILEEIKVIMKQEIENMKLGDEIIKELNKVEKWLNENWEKIVKNLLDLEGRIRKKEEEIKKLEGIDGDEAKEKDYRLKTELIQLKKEQESIKTELNGRLEKYDGTSVSIDELVIETFGERMHRLGVESSKKNKRNNDVTTSGQINENSSSPKENQLNYIGDNSSNLQITEKNEEGGVVNETLEDVNQRCNSFSASINGVLNVHALTNLFKNLIERNKLKISSNNKLRRIIDLDILDYEIGILNIGALNNKNFRITKRNSNIDNKTQYFETNKEGLTKISQQCSNGWQVASQTDIQYILKTLSKNYQLTSGRSGNIHDEDIAFFMLITKSDGEFLLKKNRVLKCYHDFRGFKDMRENGTGQIILIRKRR